MCLHAVEHVPGPERVVAECARLVRPGGTAVLSTPNRLTFLRADEIIDPYHEIEFDPDQLRALCEPHFAAVEIHGLFGSARYMEFFRRERAKLDARLRLDPLRLRRFVPRRLKRALYDWSLTRERAGAADPLAAGIGPEDFSLRETNLDEALDLFAVCRRPEQPREPNRRLHANADAFCTYPRAERRRAHLVRGRSTHTKEAQPTRREPVATKATMRRNATRLPAGKKCRDVSASSTNNRWLR